MTTANLAAVGSLARLLTPSSLGISTEIAPDDGMYGGNLEHYLSVCHSALRCLGASALLAGSAEPGRILDLPSGHGRVMRGLRAAFPRAELTACDPSVAAVEECRRAFGAVPLASPLDPSVLHLDGRYDIVWCGSLFTHLDLERWRAFLSLFDRHLAPGGLLVFTTHGRKAHKWLRDGHTEYGLTALQMYGLDSVLIRSLVADADKTGFGYVDFPGHRGHGVSLSTLPFVVEEVQRHTSLRLVTTTEHGWDNHHDVIACAKPG